MEVSNPPVPQVSFESPRASDPEALPEPSGGRSFAEVFRGLGERIDAGDELVHRVQRAGPSLDATQLIVLQAEIYRHTEAVELTSKLVDRAGNAVKTTIQGQ